MSRNEIEMTTFVRNARTEELMQGRKFIDPTQITSLIFQSDRMTLYLVEDNGTVEHNAILVCLYSGSGDEEELQHQWVMDLGQADARQNEGSVSTVSLAVALASEFSSRSEERQGPAHLQIYNYPGGAIWAEVREMVDMDLAVKSSALVAWNLLTSLAAMGSDLYDLTDGKRKIIISKLLDAIREHCQFADVKHEESNEVTGAGDLPSGGEIPEGADEDERGAENDERESDGINLDLSIILKELNGNTIKLMTLDVAMETGVIRHVAILVSMYSGPAANGEYKVEHQWTMDFSNKKEHQENRRSGSSGGCFGLCKEFAALGSTSPAHLGIQKYPRGLSWKVLQKVTRIKIEDRDDCGMVKKLLYAIASVASKLFSLINIDGDNCRDFVTKAFKVIKEKCELADEIEEKFRKIMSEVRITDKTLLRLAGACHMAVGSVILCFEMLVSFAYKTIGRSSPSFSRGQNWRNSGRSLWNESRAEQEGDNSETDHQIVLPTHPQTEIFALTPRFRGSFRAITSA